MTRGYRLLLLSIGLVALLFLGSHLAPIDSQPIPRSLAEGELTSMQHEDLGYVLYVPTTASHDRPNPLLVAFYGMGGDANSFAESLSGMAERNGWVLLVPRFTYGDWKQVDAVRKDDKEQLPHLRKLIDALPEETGLRFQDRIMLYGFSRGAQAAHRFALMYNDKVLAVAAMSAGSYTLPISRTTLSGGDQTLAYPLGVGDLASYCGEQFDPADEKKVSFWVGVGELDNNPDDVPRPWDRYLGSTRLERAKSFAQGMASLVGARVQLDIIPGLGHAESEESRGRAEAFLRGEETRYLEGTSSPEAQGSPNQRGG